MKALKWQLMQSQLSENFGKWRPYLELFFFGGGQRGGAEISLRGGSLALLGTAPGSEWQFEFRRSKVKGQGHKVAVRNAR